jgi:hypothetical protein
MPSGRMVLVGPFDSLRVNRLIESKYAPIIMGVLTMVVALLDTHDQEARDTSSLKAWWRQVWCAESKTLSDAAFPRFTIKANIARLSQE